MIHTEPYHQSAYTANTLTTISRTELPANHWLQRKKKAKMNAGEKIVKGSLFCLPSSYPSDSQGPCKELILLICHLVQNNFNFT